MTGTRSSDAKVASPTSTEPPWYDCCLEIIRPDATVGSFQFYWPIFYNFTACSCCTSTILVMVILSVHPSVCPFVCVLHACFMTKWKKHSADILIPHERVIKLVFWHQDMLVADVPYHLKFAVKVTHLRLKNADFDQYLLITSQP